MVKKAAGTAPAAGSTEPAVNGAAAPALNGTEAAGGAAQGSAQDGAQDAGQGTDQGGTQDAGATVIEPIPSFPRLVAIVNDTPIPYVVAGTYVAGHETAHVAVNDEDEITRMKSDCEQIMSLNDTHKDRDEPALRVTEVE